MLIRPVARCVPLLKSLSVVSRRWQFVRHTSYDTDGKTTVTILNEDESGILIDSYSQIGFRLNNGMVVLGPMAVFPRTVLSWKVPRVEDITEESLSLFCALAPKIDILIIGYGDSAAGKNLNKDAIKLMRKHKINVETLPTDQACTTFNFLNAEKRYVAGVFIPPLTLRFTDDDVLLSKGKRQMLENSDLIKL